MPEESCLASILRGFIGREITYVDEFEIEKGMCRRFAIALGNPNPLYGDEEFSKTTEYGGIVAPPTMIFEWNHNKRSVISPEQRASIFASLPHQPTFVRGINEYEIIQPLRPGDIITSHAKITDINEKQGKSGPLVFMVYETIYLNQKAEILAKSKDTTIVLP
jgi:acyl dehydratase